MREQIAKGGWGAVTGKPKQNHSNLTNDGLRCIDGNGGEPIGRIENAGGAPREEPERLFAGRYQLKIRPVWRGTLADRRNTQKTRNLVNQE